MFHHVNRGGSIITITTLRGEVGADVVLVPGCAGEGIAPTTFVFESYGELRPDLLPPLVVLQFAMRLSTIFLITCVSEDFRPLGPVRLTPFSCCLDVLFGSDE